jgi:hypothetical protein
MEDQRPENPFVAPIIMSYNNNNIIIIIFSALQGLPSLPKNKSG